MMLDMTPENTCLLIVDVQEKLCRAIPALNLGRVRQLTSGMAALHCAVVASEQVPSKLGATLPEISELLPDGSAVLAKSTFPVTGDAKLAQALEKYANVVLCGVECHVCVMQSALELQAAGKSPIIAADAVASRCGVDCETALELMRHKQMEVTTVESILFRLLRSAENPAFRAVSLLVREIPRNS